MRKNRHWLIDRIEYDIWDVIIQKHTSFKYFVLGYVIYTDYFYYLCIWDDGKDINIYSYEIEQWKNHDQE